MEKEYFIYHGYMHEMVQDEEERDINIPDENDETSIDTSTDEYEDIEKEETMADRYERQLLKKFELFPDLRIKRGPF